MEQFDQLKSEAVIRNSNSVNVVQSCINCGQLRQENYCSNCGQSLKVEKISWKGLVHEFNVHLFGLDTKLARTMKDLSIQPAKVVNDYLAGNRVRYFGPLGYYIVVSAILVLVISIFDVKVEEMMQLINKEAGLQVEGDKKTAELNQTILKTIGSFFRFFTIFFIPFYVLALRSLYKNKGLKFLEHGVVYLFCASHLLWFSVIQMIIFGITGETYSLLSFLIPMLYSGFFFMKVLGRTSVLQYLKGVFTYILGFVYFILFVVLIVVILITFKLVTSLL